MTTSYQFSTIRQPEMQARHPISAVDERPDELAQQAKAWRHAVESSGAEIRQLTGSADPAKESFASLLQNIRQTIPVSFVENLEDDTGMPLLGFASQTGIMLDASLIENPGLARRVLLEEATDYRSLMKNGRASQGDLGAAVSARLNDPEAEISHLSLEDDLTRVNGQWGEASVNFFFNQDRTLNEQKTLYKELDFTRSDLKSWGNYSSDHRLMLTSAFIESHENGEKYRVSGGDDITLDQREPTVVDLHEMNKQGQPGFRERQNMLTFYDSIIRTGIYAQQPNGELGNINYDYKKETNKRWNKIFSASDDQGNSRLFLIPAVGEGRSGETARSRLRGAFDYRDYASDEGSISLLIDGKRVKFVADGRINLRVDVDTGPWNAIKSGHTYEIPVFSAPNPF